MAVHISTDLLRDESANDGFLSPDVELNGFGAFKRVCRTCRDPVGCAMAGTGDDGASGRAHPDCPHRNRS